MVRLYPLAAFGVPTMRGFVIPPKTFVPKVGGVFDNSMTLSAVAPWKAPSPMDVTLGVATLTRCMRPENAQLPMDVTLGMLMCLKLVPANIPGACNVPFGIVVSAGRLSVDPAALPAPWNARAPMVVASGNSTFVSAVAPRKA